MGRGGRPVRAPPRLRLAVLGAHVPSSPETGLNGSSDPAGLALPRQKSEPHKGQHCVLLRPPRGCEHGPSDWNTLRAQATILGRHPLNEKKKKKSFLCPHKRKCVPGCPDAHFSKWEPEYVRILLFKTIIYKLYLPTEKCNSNFQLTYILTYQPPNRHPLPFQILLTPPEAACP